MPRRLLRDLTIVDDDWQYADGGVPAEGIPVIIGFEQWQQDRAAWIGRRGRLGVALKPEHRVEQLAPDIGHFALIAAQFTGPTEGRGYTQGRLLRERHHFDGELRAAGYVRIDQLFFLARCGFNSFELPDGDLDSAYRAFATFSAAYQPSNDRGLATVLKTP